jgi:hypothetical protein
MPQSWGMLYAESGRRDDVLKILAGVRDDERQADANYDPEKEAEPEPAATEVPSDGE